MGEFEKHQEILSDISKNIAIVAEFQARFFGLTLDRIKSKKKPKTRSYGNFKY